MPTNEYILKRVESTIKEIPFENKKIEILTNVGIALSNLNVAQNNYKELQNNLRKIANLDEQIDKRRAVDQNQIHNPQLNNLEIRKSNTQKKQLINQLTLAEIEVKKCRELLRAEFLKAREQITEQKIINAEINLQPEFNEAAPISETLDNLFDRVSSLTNKQYCDQLKISEVKSSLEHFDKLVEFGSQITDQQNKKQMEIATTFHCEFVAKFDSSQDNIKITNDIKDFLYEITDESKWKDLSNSEFKNSLDRIFTIFAGFPKEFYTDNANKKGVADILSTAMYFHSSTHAPFIPVFLIENIIDFSQTQNLKNTDKVGVILEHNSIIEFFEEINSFYQKFQSLIIANDVDGLRSLREIGFNRRLRALAVMPTNSMKIINPYNFNDIISTDLTTSTREQIATKLETLNHDASSWEKKKQEFKERMSQLLLLPVEIKWTTKGVRLNVLEEQEERNWNKLEMEQIVNNPDYTPIYGHRQAMIAINDQISSKSQEFTQSLSFALTQAEQKELKSQFEQINDIFLLKIAVFAPELKEPANIKAALITIKDKIEQYLVSPLKEKLDIIKEERELNIIKKAKNIIQGSFSKNYNDEQKEMLKQECNQAENILDKLNFIVETFDNGDIVKMQELENILLLFDSNYLKKSLERYKQDKQIIQVQDILSIVKTLPLCAQNRNEYIKKINSLKELNKLYSLSGSLNIITKQVREGGDCTDYQYTNSAFHSTIMSIETNHIDFEQIKIQIAEIKQLSETGASALISIERQLEILFEMINDAYSSYGSNQQIKQELENAPLILSIWDEMSEIR
jgi:hypothetical protein